MFLFDQNLEPVDSQSSSIKLATFQCHQQKYLGICKDLDISQMFMVKKLVPGNQKGFIQYLSTLALHQVEHLASLEEVDFIYLLLWSSHS